MGKASSRSAAFSDYNSTITLNITIKSFTGYASGTRKV